MCEQIRPHSNFAATFLYVCASGLRCAGVCFNRRRWWWGWCWRQVLIYVDVAAAMSDGVAFFRSSNNVILTCETTTERLSVRTGR